MLDIEATFSPYPDAAAAAPPPLSGLRVDVPADASAAAPQDVAEAAGPRAVTPRRPLRFTSARSAEESPAIALAIPNIFDGVFDTEDHLTDPRLQRGRARARSLLARHEAALSDAERNLWHDDPQHEPAPEPIVAQPAPVGRRVRHLTAADLAARALPGSPATSDPLRDRLINVRAALYAPDPDADAEAAARDTTARPLPERLTAQVLNITLLTVALPVGATVATITLLRGEDLTLSARTIAIVGTISAFLQLAPLPSV